VCACRLPLEHILVAPCVCCLDFDDDGTLDREDLSQLVNCLTGEGEDTRLSASEMKQLIDNVSCSFWLGWGVGWEGLELTHKALSSLDPGRVRH
jgi:hypothetical protein